MELLELWEQGYALNSLERAIQMVCASKNLSSEQARELPIGQRDATLLDMRSHHFGDLCVCTDACQHCSSVVEFEFSIASLLHQVNDQRRTRFSFEKDAFCINVRLPTTGDIEHVLNNCLEKDQLETALFRQCILSSTEHGKTISPDELPEEISQSVLTAMGEAQDLADIQFQLTCNQCDYQWSAPFDIARFFWEEIDRHVRRLLHEVHRIASAYGWSDQQILSLSPQRRTFYLECIGI
jgi:hypothetical protein